MEVNIWSDVRCPFCYIGKHKFETALEQFKYRDNLKINWRSFELNPDLQTDTDINALDHLAQSKGISREQVDRMTGHVARAAFEVGLTIETSETVVANSFNAHRLIQFSKTKGLGSDVKETLFQVHFAEGKNIDDIDILCRIGVEAGLDGEEVKSVLTSGDYTDEVKSDEKTARSIGINGVPFFVFNDKYAVSGAQPPDTFLEVLEKSWEEFEEDNRPTIVNEGSACSANGNCD